MVAPGFLENPEVRRWLNGVEPAWTMLEFKSLNALRPIKRRRALIVGYEELGSLLAEWRPLMAFRHSVLVGSNGGLRIPGASATLDYAMPLPDRTWTCC
jgi:hypothetical protein